MTEAEILTVFESSRALIRNSHLIYTSGRHGNTYVNKDALYPFPELTSQLCLEIARRTKDLGAEVVVAPALGGILLAQWTAFHLGKLTGKPVLSVYAEKTDDGKGFVLRRGYDEVVRGKKILLLEDILTTGISIKRVVDLVGKVGGNILAVYALWNRGGISAADIGAPKLDALVNMKFDSWDAGDCPLCAKKVPLNTSVGKAR